MKTSIPLQIAQKLIFLSQKYENPSFTDDDPSQFLRRYTANSNTKDKCANTEAAAFIAAMLSFGNRKQFIPKISFILDSADSSSGCIAHWLKTGAYKTLFPHGKEKFYRFYSYDDMHDLFGDLAKVLLKSPDGTMGGFFKANYEEKNAELSNIISEAFPNAKIVPKGKTSANKRIHMFLRWMVRQNSSVDLGLWSWYSSANLVIPLDTHVLQEAILLGLLPKDSKANLKTAKKLSEQMNLIFPGDPVRADYALFGLGVDKNP